MKNKQLETSLVILGITGDLAKKKIIPALFNLYSNRKLPKKFSIVGFSRRPWQDQHLKDYITEVIQGYQSNPDATHLGNFLKLFTHVQGTFEETEGFKRLKSHLGNPSNILFYLSVSPEFYPPILRHLKNFKLLQKSAGTHISSKILIEKPFGSDGSSAEKLEKILSGLHEKQIYRIDHYLAKEMTRALFTFRFYNDFFEHLWNNKYIESIDIKLWESMGVEHRINYYDSVGALRDVGQNHLLELLALITMTKPKSLQIASVRNARERILSTLIPFSPKSAAQNSFRAQYTGYKNIIGSAPDTRTETYFSIKNIYLSDPRWKNVRISIEGGKRLREVRKEIIVTFKRHSFRMDANDEYVKNRIIFSFEPEEGISIRLKSKEPGLDHITKSDSLGLQYRSQENRKQYVEEYEKLLTDAIKNDQTLFLSKREVLSMWRFIDPIIKCWNTDKVALHAYLPNSVSSQDTNLQEDIPSKKFVIS